MNRFALVVPAGVLAMLLPAYSAITYTEEIPAFRFEQDRYAVKNGAKGEWTTNRLYRVSVENAPNFWMYYDAFPGLKPFRGMSEIVLKTDMETSGVIGIQLREFPNGKVMKFMSPIRKECRFAVNLDPSRLYDLHCIEMYRNPWDKKPWQITFISLAGVFTTSEADALRVDVETGNPLRLVREGMNDKAVLSIVNASQTEIAVNGKLEMIGFFGDKYDIPVDCRIAGGGKKLIPFPVVAKKGVWKISGDLHAGDGSTVNAKARYAVIDRHDRTPKQPKGTFRLGINYHMGRFSHKDQRYTVAALIACGAKLVRAGVNTTMSSVQPNGPDEWNFEAGDKMLSLLEWAGLSIDSGVFFFPKWAALPEHRDNPDWHVWAEGLPIPEVYERFCEKLAARYGTRIDYYEVGNEWDLGFRGTVDEAVEIQRRAYVGLKKGCKDACVISNGWASPDDNPQVVRSGHKGFHETFLRKAKDWFDVHPIHMHGAFSPYANRIENQFFPLRERTGVANKPWYSNETALTSVWNEPSVAQTVWKKIVWAWSRGSVDYIWYNLKGTGWDPNDPEQGYGLISADYKPRDGYVAFAALASTVGGKTFKREVFHLASRYVFEFAGNDDITLVAWDETATGPIRVAVKTDAKKAYHVDLMGNRTPLSVDNGAVEFTFDANPAAVVLQGARVAKPDLKALADIPPPNAKPILIHRDAPGREPDFILSTASQVHDFFEANPAEIKRVWKGPSDQSAKAWLACEEKGLRLRVAVEDDVHEQRNSDGEQFLGDDIQVALASHLQSGHWELGFARRNDGEPSVYCWIAPNGFDAKEVAKKLVLKTERSGTVTSYDAFVPYDAIGFSEKLLHQGIRFNMMINDNDGDGRDAFIEIKPNNFSSKNPGQYPFVKFENDSSN